MSTKPLKYICHLCDKKIKHFANLKLCDCCGHLFCLLCFGDMISKSFAKDTYQDLCICQVSGYKSTYGPKACIPKEEMKKMMEKKS